MASLLRQRCQVSIRQLGSLRPGRAPSGPRIWTGRRLAADFSAPKPPLPPPPSRGLLRRYTTLLETRPLTTKAVTAAILGFLGDAVAQLGVQVQLGVDPKQLTFDVKRSAIFTSFAGALAPVLHFWYLYLLRIGSQTIPGVLKRVALDQFGFAPIFFGFVLSFLTFAENRADTETESLINKWFDTLVLNWKIWIPAQMINFMLVPPIYQVLFSNSLGLVMNVIISVIVHRKVPPVQDMELADFIEP